MKTTITRAVTGLAAAAPLFLLAATSSAQALTASTTGVSAAVTSVNTGAGAEVVLNLALLSISAVMIIVGAVYATRSDHRLAQ